jgi:hypothetical protein
LDLTSARAQRAMKGPNSRKEGLHQNLGFAKLKPDPPHTALYNTEMKSSAACVCHKYTHRDLKLLTSSLPVGS